MKPELVLAIALVLFQSASGDEPANESVALVSMHGTMIMLIDETHGNEMEVWAKGNNVRSEIKSDSAKIVVIQRGDTLYTFRPGRKFGHRTKFQSGLASRGLIEQISLVKSNGKRDGSKVVNGTKYDQYSYEADAPQESALVLLEAKTSLPKDWASVVKNGDGEPRLSRTIFRDMQANVEVADTLFELPRQVEFENVTAGDLMATPLPVPPSDNRPGQPSSR